MGIPFFVSYLFSVLVYICTLNFQVLLKFCLSLFKFEFSLKILSCLLFLSSSIYLISEGYLSVGKVVLDQRNPKTQKKKNTKKVPKIQKKREIEG